VPIRSFAVPPAFRFVLRIVTKMQQCVETFVGLHPNAAAIASVTAGRPAAGNKFLASERSDAVPAVSGLHTYFYSIYKHRVLF
jgi:hypothetical protein